MENDTILFVDDERNILHSLKRLLRKEPYSLMVANSGAEALDLLEHTPVNIVISDQRMPEMTGVELLQRVKERYPETIRVILSGYADVSGIVEAINKGEIYRFLAKPWNDEELKIAIRQCFEQYNLRNENRTLLAQVKTQNEQLKEMNQELEYLLEDRTAFLKVFQDTLEKLPVPILGIDSEEKIIICNQCAQDTFSSMHQLFPGTKINDIFHDEILSYIQQVLNGQELSPHSFVLDGAPVKVQAALLKNLNMKRGCILVLNPEADK